MKDYGKCFLMLWVVLLMVNEINSITEDSSEVEMDNFISEYVEEVRRTLGIGLEKHFINKRSYPDLDLNKISGVEVLVGFQEVHSLPSRFPQDIVLFSQCLSNETTLYAAAIETQPDGSLQDTKLILYKYQEDNWRETHRVQAAGGQNIAVEHIEDFVYVVVAQQLADEDRGSTVWRLPPGSDTLQFVHMLNNNTRLASRAIMWTDTHTYSAVAISENPSGSQKPYSTLSPVYRWHGSSFDMIDVLPTFNPRAIAQFKIRSAVFLAVANFQNDNRETMIDSEIFRYDLTTDKFHVYQKLPTEAAVDIKAFCYQSNQITESFLIYASAFHTDEQGIRDYNSPSVVYKLSDEEFFVPFQALKVSKVTSWLPIDHVKDGVESLTLIGASGEGIVSFQYDGWRFVPTGFHVDSFAFGPGPKTLNVFYYRDKPFISVANVQSSGYEMNVLSPVFKYHPGVDNLQKTISNWVERISLEMVEAEAKITELAGIAQEAPSVDDSVINLGSHAVFRNVEIRRLETIATKVGDSSADAQVYLQLCRLKSHLENMKISVADLPNRIDQTSIHTNTVYHDTFEEVADITCIHSCQAQDLEVAFVNNENFSEFVANTVNIMENIEFSGNISFKELSVIEPLETKMINGHDADKIIDWSKEVVIDHKLKVEGDVFCKDSVHVLGAVDGVFINNVKEQMYESEASLLPSTIIQTLNTSSLTLADGKISNVDFANFISSTLKTEGDQSFSVFQDIGRLKAVEVEAPDLFRAVSFPPSQRSSCADENCSEEEVKFDQPLDQPSPRARSKKIDSINLLDDEIIIPRNITLYGTLIVENGSLSASDFIDLKYNVSANKLLNLAIPLNQSIINQHFKFKEFKTSSLNVDKINSMSLESLVKLKGEESVNLTGNKTFYGSVSVDGTLHLKFNEEVLEQTDIEHLDVKAIKSNNINIGANNWENKVVIRKDGIVVIKSLEVEDKLSANSAMLRGKINNYHLEDLLNDSVFEEDDNLRMDGTKNFSGGLEILSLGISHMNISDIPKAVSESIWRKRLSEAKHVEVDHLFYTGQLEGVDARVFGRWMLTDTDQSVTGSQAATSLEADNVVMSSDATINSHNITHLLTEAVLLNENATLDSVIFDGLVSAAEVQVGGTINSLQVPADIVVAAAAANHIFTGHKRVRNSITVSGDLVTSGPVSNINITTYCQALLSDQAHLIFSGNGKFIQEPEISTSVNDVEWSKIMQNVWYKDKNVTISKRISMTEAEIKNLAVNNINNNNIEEKLSRLVTLSRDQQINGSLYFPNVRAERGLRAEEATVGGHVQGIQLPSFTKHVLLNGVNQEIEGYLDFNKLVIKHDFNNLWYVNGLNLSSDVMLANVESNAVTGELAVNQLHTKMLRLPAGALVAGVNISQWSSTAVTKSGVQHVVTGNITVMGQLDSSHGVRVERLLNGLPFDKKHVMLLNEDQQVSGKKSFSSNSNLMIHNLTVAQKFNDMNVSAFYNEQVTASGDVRLSGSKHFTAPLWSERALLPQIYQNHNLTWLEDQLSAPLPWSTHDAELARIIHAKQLASQYLAGRAYYLRTMTRTGDIEGDVLFTMPLRSANLTVLGVVRNYSTVDPDSSITLSLLHWNEENSSFVPDGVTYFLKVVPSQVQMVPLPGGDVAAYITSYLPHNVTSSVGHGDLLRLKEDKISQMTIHGAQPGSDLVSFLDYKHRTCYVVVSNLCRAVCYPEGQPSRIIRLPKFDCKNITKATTFRTDRGQYLLGVQTKPRGSLLMWRMSASKFVLVQELPLFNPVSIAATTTNGPHIAVANLHRLGYSQKETVDILRLDENTTKLHLWQSLPVVSPSSVVFSTLPSSESVLYVSSTLPASPLQIYIYRGLEGYQLLMSDATLPVPCDLQPFSDHHHRHFLVLPSNSSASVLKAEFEGSR